MNVKSNLSAPAWSGLACFVFGSAALALPMLISSTPASAQDLPSAESFIDNFEKLDRKRWYISDGWANGDHQNCTWSKRQVSVDDGALSLGFEKQKTKDREFACGEIQTHKRFGYGTYEVRMKAVNGSGLNTGFFTYIGPTHKQPHDEIDFEILGKDTSQVQVNQYVAAKGGNEKLVPVAGGADTDFNDYAFVWEKDRIRWYVNGELVHTADDPAKLPSHSSKIYLSLWSSDVFKEWMGPFSDPGAPVAAEIQRVSFTKLSDECQFEESVACKLN